MASEDEDDASSIDRRNILDRAFGRVWVHVAPHWDHFVNHFVMIHFQSHFARSEGVVAGAPAFYLAVFAVYLGILGPIILMVLFGWHIDLSDLLAGIVMIILLVLAWLIPSILVRSAARSWHLELFLLILRLAILLIPPEIWEVSPIPASCGCVLVLAPLVNPVAKECLDYFELHPRRYALDISEYRAAWTVAFWVSWYPGHESRDRRRYQLMLDTAIRGKEHVQPTTDASPQETAYPAHIVKSTKAGDMPKALGSADPSHDLSPYIPGFIRCSCCVSLDEDAPEPSISLSAGSDSSLDIEEVQMWPTRQAHSSAAYDQGRSQQLDDVATDDVELSRLGAKKKFKLNRLCTKCSHMAETSKILSKADMKSGRWRNLLRGQLYIDEKFSHWEDVQLLHKSAEQDFCHFCSMIWFSLSSRQRKELQHQLVEINRLLSQLESRRTVDCDNSQRLTLLKRRQVWIRIQVGLLGSEIEITPHFGGLQLPRDWFFMLQSQSAAGEIIMPGLMPVEPIMVNRGHGSKDAPSMLGKNLGGDSAIKNIRKFIRKKIRRTPQNQRAAFCPTRLLDLGDKHCESVRSISAGEVEEREGPHVEYVALSHVWGPDNIGTLTSAKLDSYRNEIPTEKLTKNFQQAVSTIRRLGIRYAWIDAFCIVQDDPADWESEALNMSLIFQHATFVLATVASPKSSTGFFRALNPLPRSTCLLKKKRVEKKLFTKAFTEYVYATPPKIHASDLHVADVELSAWNQRAWCFQERQLARRVLYFGNRGIYYEERASATYHLPRRYRMDLDDGSFTRVYDGETETETGSEVAKESVTADVYLGDKWWSFVSAFSTRALTDPNDKLPAISGLATLLQQELNRRCSPDYNAGYVAGLWHGSMARDLLWFTTSWESRRPSAYRGPSWSWASIEAACANSTVSDVSANTAGFDLLYCHTRGVNQKSSPAGGSLSDLPRGAVESGLLHVRGKIRKAAWTPASQTMRYAVNEKSRLVFETKIDTPRTTNDEGGEDEESEETLTESGPSRSFSLSRLDATSWLSRDQYLSRLSPVRRAEPGERALDILRLPYEGPEDDSSTDQSSYDGQELGGQIGWFVPDIHHRISQEPLHTAQNRLNPGDPNSEIVGSSVTPKDLYCFQIRVEPDNEQQRSDPWCEWSIRGLALTPVDVEKAKQSKHWHPDIPAHLPVFRRVGWFLIDYEVRDDQLTWPVYPRKLSFRGKYHPVRRPELVDIDPKRFFTDAEATEFVII